MRTFFSQRRIFKTAPLVILLISSVVFAQNALISNQKNNLREEITIEEKWRGYDWTNNIRCLNTYDSEGNCVSKLMERWNSYRWENESWEKYTFDELHHKTSSILLKWNKDSGKWIFSEGSRAVIDTSDRKSNRIVLHNASWNPSSNSWDSEDSIFYDKKGRIIKTVNRDLTVSDSLNDTLLIIETTENSYQGDKVWIEQSKTWRSDTKETVSDRYRYRMINDAPMELYAIDYWDDKMNRWIPNTAKLFRKVENNYIVLDSIEEIIDDRSVPVYVSSETRDIRGNVMQHRFWQKSIDEATKKWTGTYIKWERNYNAEMNKFTIAESTFISDTSGCKWQLMNYQNQMCKIPSFSGTTEAGDYETTYKNWQFEKIVDTLVPCGLLVSSEQYYNEDKKQWLPTIKFTTIVGTDSTVVTTERLDQDKGEWNNDSLFVVRLDKSGKLLSRTNYAWARTGMLNGNWTKVSRITYITPEKKK